MTYKLNSWKGLIWTYFEAALQLIAKIDSLDTGSTLYFRDAS